MSVLVDEFSDPFHPDPLVVNVYKSKLNHHIENGVGSNLKARLSSDLQLNMETQQKDMMERMTALLPLEKQTVNIITFRRKIKFSTKFGSPNLYLNSGCQLLSLLH